MSTKKKLLQAAAGAASAEVVDVDDVFSNFLYNGDGSTSRTITNGIDLSGEGGLVWVKSRSNTYNHFLLDTERGTQKVLQANRDSAEISTSNTISAFNSNGWTMGDRAEMNQSSSQTYCSWTFRKHPKFFDVQTFTTTYNTDPNVISHNLESDLGCAIFKQRNATGQGYNWIVWHRSLGLTKYLKLNANSGQTSDSNSIEAVDNSSGTISFGYPMSNVADRLVSGSTETTSWVGYFFAHNNNDGEFGPNADQDIIKCGSYVGNGGTQSINLGFEPQWVMFKRYDSGDNWYILDSMRGFVDLTTGDKTLIPNDSNAEQDLNSNFFGSQGPSLTATGFRTNAAALNGNGNSYLYIAIRRGSLAEPTSATDVFTTDQRGGTSPTPPTFTSGFVTDFGIWFKTGTQPKEMNYRLAQNITLDTNASTAEDTQTTRSFDYMNGFGDFTSSNTSQYAWMWKRAPSFCDVATYSGNNQTSAITVNHSLGVIPEMMWCKKRGASGDWMVYHKDLNGGTNPHTYRLRLNSTGGEGTGSGVWNAAPTATQFSVGTDYDVNSGTAAHVTFLFATLAGISKVGSYTGNGSSLTIDCGFSSGARFVLIKKISGASPWLCFDTKRGIVTGNENAILLNQTTAQNSADYIDPSSSGFIVNLTYSEADQYNPNQTSGEYIFYAIA